VSKFFRRIFNTAVIGVMSILIVSAFTLTAFAASPGDVDAWADTTSLPQNLTYSNSVTYNGFAYTIGGDNGSSLVDTVYSAPLNLDGTIGAWTATTSLPQPLSGSTSVVYNGYVYVIGGYNGSSPLVDTVYSAPLNLDGTVGAWTTSVNTLPQTVNDSISIAYNGYIYVMSGFNGSTLQNTVYSASVNNGTVGAWATSANTLPQALQYASAITYNGYVYVIGGLGSIEYSDSVYSAPLGVNGTIGTWATSPNSLPQALLGHNAVSYNGYAYVIGGDSNSGLSDSVYSAPLGVNGTIGTWATSPNSLPQVLRFASAITYNGYAYNIGGGGMSGYIDNVYYAQLTGYLPPSSSSQPASASSGSNVTVDVLAGVSGNPDPSTLQIITGPLHGAATISGDNITYTATDGYIGSDSLVFQICSLNDASLCTQSTLSFTVTAAVTTIAPPNTGLEPTNYMLAAISIVAGFGLMLVARRRYS